MKFMKSLIVCMMLLLSFSSYAEEENESSVKFTFDLGVHAGGDTLVTAYFTDGSTEKIEAGDGVSIAFGAIFDLTENLELATTYGYKNASINGSNGSVDWTRYPLNILFLYKMDKLRIGGGLTYHMSPKLDGDGSGSAINADFDNALGTLLDVRYFFTDTLYFGARATFIDYKPTGGSRSFNGDSVGITFGYSS